MYKIMLADDEGIVIDSLRFIIEKEFGSKCQIEFAKTGRSVIELAESFRPDIAIMDIQMPGINGIEAMKEIRHQNKNVIFIVMSAFDKFDYAQEAIKLGVMEYITKPMERTRIVRALRQAMDRVDQDRERRSQDLLTKEKLETVVPVIENGLIYDLLFQEYFEEDVNNYKTLLGIQQNYAYMAAVVCGDTQEGNHMTNAVGSSVRVQQHIPTIRMVLKEGFPGCIVGAVMGNKIAVLVPCDGPSVDYNERIRLIENSRKLVRELRRRTDCLFRIGMGSVRVMRELPLSYQEGLESLVQTTGSVAHADDLPVSCRYEENYPVELERKLFAAVDKGEMDMAVNLAGQFYRWMLENYPQEFMSIRLKVLEFVLYAEHRAYLQGGMTYIFTDRQDYLPRVMHTENRQELGRWFVDKIRGACQKILHKSSEKSVSLMDQAKAYINQNYHRDISLDDVSRRVGISPYYFSKIFKEDTGEGFIEYLTKIRMERARELLATSNYSMKEICSQVGYADPNYFSRSFKKNVGLTPTEYKEKRRQG